MLRKTHKLQKLSNNNLNLITICNSNWWTSRWCICLITKCSNSNSNKLIILNSNNNFPLVITNQTLSNLKLNNNLQISINHKTNQSKIINNMIININNMIIKGEIINTIKIINTKVIITKEATSPKIKTKSGTDPG